MQIDVALTPAQARRWNNHLCVVIDVIRASSSIVAMFDRGVSAVIVSSNLALARRLARKHGHLLAGEREGLPPKGFDFGNSPREIARLDLAGKGVVFTSTNGTVALKQAGHARAVIIGCFMNATACCRAAFNWAAARQADIGLVCAGLHGGFAFDDAVCAGYLVKTLLSLGQEQQETLTLTDSALAALAVYRGAGDPEKALAESSSGHRTSAIGHQADITLCAAVDTSNTVPRLIYEGELMTLVP